MDAGELYADNVTNRIVHRHVTSSYRAPLKYHDLWSMHLTRFHGHVYAKMYLPTCTFYTRMQLHKLHHQFGHPSAVKLHNLLKLSGLQAVDASTLALLEDIIARCEPCQTIRNAQRRFRVTIGQEDGRFDAEAYIDVMYLDGKPVLHIVDSATRFSEARFLPRISTDAVWEAIVMCWSKMYTGLPQCIVCTKDPNFANIR